MTYPHQVARYHCPIGKCGWTVDDAGPEISALPGAVTYFPGDLARELAARVEAVIRTHVESHDLAELVGEIVRLRDLVPDPAPDLTAVPWRQGRRKGRNLYAVTGPDWEAHPEIGCLDSPELAREAVEAHNAALNGELENLHWLLAAGWLVRFGKYTDRPEFSVCLTSPHWDMRIVDGATPADAVAKARELSQRERITP